MLKHNKPKKLALHTETIRSLADRDLIAVNGAQADTIKDCQKLTATRYPICQPTIPFTLCVTTLTVIC